MKISQGVGHEPSLQRLVIAALVLHFILMAFLFIPFNTGEKEFKTYYVSLAEPSKVIGGGEPAVRKAEEKPVAKKETPAKEKKIAEDKEIAAKKDQMFLNEEKQRQAAIEKVEKDKAIRDAKNALSKGKEDRDKTREIEVVRREINEASAKGAGAPGKGEHMASDSYFGLITDKIRNEWEIPPDFDSAGLEVIISIKIDSKGKVVSKTIDKSSGNILFDQSALKAISKASPLPLPPPLVEREVEMRFYP